MRNTTNDFMKCAWTLCAISGIQAASKASRHCSVERKTLHTRSAT